MSLPATTYDTAAAERRAERIRLRLDAIADNIDAVLPMIREAIEKGDHAALGYRSVGEYVSDRFGGALTRLPVDLRRPVVHELASAGMSTRAIAPVVGVSQKTASRDVLAGESHDSPEPTVNTETGEVSDDYPAEVLPAGPGEAAVTSPAEGLVETPPAPRPSVTGIDGKTYPRPEPKGPAKPRRGALTDDARNAGWELRKAVERLERIATDDRFTANKEAVAPHLRSHLTNAIEVCQDLLDRISN